MNKQKETRSKRKKEVIVVSVGGSLIVPDDIDTSFIQAFKRCLLGYSKQGIRFVVICGGGSTARTYQNSASHLSKVSQTDLDWIGIQATFLNASLVRTAFGKAANSSILTDFSERPQFQRGRSMIIAGGWKPGCSTDTDAVIAAELLGAKRVVNLSNIDYVYDKDPRKHQDAKAFKDITWKEYRDLIPKKWNAGLSTPFDPVAARRAERSSIEVALINGKKLAQFEHYINERGFKGTRIHT